MHVLNDQTETLFQGLSDFTRIRLIRLLVSTREEICLCEFVDSLYEAEYKISRHLKILKQSGLLSARKEGRWVYHRLIPKIPHLKELYSVVKKLPDQSGTFKKDLANFRRRLSLRQNGRCQTGIQDMKPSEQAK